MKRRQHTSSHPDKGGKGRSEDVHSTRPVGLRIISGRFGGRRLTYSGSLGVRPMKDRVRQAVFNLLGYTVEGTHAIDLFAGTGALGLEAISRGALRGTLVERHAPTAEVVRRNVASLGLESVCHVVTADAFSWAERFLSGIANPNACELPAKDERPTGADQGQPSGSSHRLAALPPCTTTNLKDCESLHKNERPTGADQGPPSGSSHRLAALPPCGPEPWLVFCCPPYAFFVDRRQEMLTLIRHVIDKSPPKSVFVLESDDRFFPDDLPHGDAWDHRPYPPAHIRLLFL